jgi:peptidoglycan/LPS O-acetylase OafA/YrhL
MIRSLTSFRFIAAFIIFLFHCSIHFDWRVGSKLVDKFFLNGATFMTGFFVLSGFIMTHVYSNTDFTKRGNTFNFYLKRFAKIYPSYAFATIVYFIFLHDYTSKQILRVLITNPFLVQGFFPNIFGIGMNGATWSLTVEMFLYFLFPFLILLSAKSPKILIASLLIAAITSFNIYADKSEYIYANPVFRLADFMCGIGFYFLNDKFKGVKFANLLHSAIVVLLICVCIKLGNDYQYMGGQFVIVPLFGAWIAMVYHSKSIIYNNKILEYLGLISYSFYLWQFVAIELVKKLFKIYPDISVLILLLSAFTINLVVSSLSYHLIEERARKFILVKFARKVPEKI